MGKVQILPADIVSKIAAGEVIERPASVVKELLENSLDAQSSQIEISLRHAGKTEIKIKDNGTGIEADDMEKLFCRHSTSKLTDIEDLSTIDSLGFRGEALYSVASISDITLKSKTPGAQTGWQIHIRGNKRLDLHPVNMPQGTEIEVKELFFNTPARKKFLKADTTEMHSILTTVIPYTLVHYGCRFLLTHANKKLLDLAPEESHIKRITSALHLPEKHLVETSKNFPQEKIFIRIILGDINIQRARKDLQFIFINNRPVQSRELSFHLNTVYRLLFPPGVSSFFCLFIQLPADTVDVNVHPTKREVKIKDVQRLVSLLRPLAENTLMSYGKAKEGKFEIPVKKGEPVSQNQAVSGPFPSAVSEPQRQYLFSHQEHAIEYKKETSPQSENLKDTLQKARYIGSFVKKYLLFETAHSLLLIDQHAAQERITYEKLKHQLASGTLQTQHLLSPIVIRVTPAEMLIWEKVKQKMETIGLATTRWDNENIALHSNPILLKSPEVAVLNLLSEEEIADSDTDTLARRACRQSITAGYEMNKEQAEYLRTQLIKCKDPFTCPHGRPTLIEMEEAVFSKQFLR